MLCPMLSSAAPRNAGTTGDMVVHEFMHRNWVLVSAAVAVAVIAASGLALYLTMPPRTLVMATGPEGGAYYEFGKRYQSILARDGVRLRLVPTSGAVENLALLRNPRSGVSVAFLQGGTTSETQAPDIESLGTVFFEPLWVFYRSEFRGMGLDALRGRKISIGPEGSGTRSLSTELLKRRGFDNGTVELLGYSPQEASEKLLAGEIDAALMLISPESLVVRKLIADSRIEIASFPNSDAYVALYPFLSKVILPAGVGDLAQNLPASDVTLFAPKASLVVRGNVHSAIQYLLLNTATQVHSGPGLFRTAGQFPAAEAIDVPLSTEAIQYYKSGRPFLQNYLPFWMASLAARLLVLLIPLVGVLYPLLRFAPVVYGWMMRRRIVRLYGELRLVEDQLALGPQGRGGVVTRLDHLAREANQLRIPTAYANMLYMLRNHIDQVRARALKQEDANLPQA